MLSRQIATCAALVGLSVIATVAMVAWPDWVTPGVTMLIVLIGAFVLRLPAMVVLVSVVLIQAMVMRIAGEQQFVPGTLVMQGVTMVVALLFVRSKDRLGLQGAASDVMLVDLRDRLTAHGRIPLLPPQWQVDSVVRPAYGDAFSGDFVVASRPRGSHVLELVLVDVSGKGQEAGVRSLLLSGAFGGLLGEMPPEEFFPTANRYLLQQEWDEGFATAVHLAVHLDTGAFWVSTAGHPPAVFLHAGSGRVETIDTTGGPALGILPAPTFTAHRGVLAPGDAVMLYTDGLVEVPGGDLELGIDRLMGEAERFVATGSGGAAAVLAGVRTGENDDRGLIVVRRR